MWACQAFSVCIEADGAALCKRQHNHQKPGEEGS